MVTFRLVRRGALILAAIMITGAASACASTPALEFVSPTMAPEQTRAEACALSKETVDRITVETEDQIKQGIDLAGADIAAGKMPSLDFLSFSIKDSLTEIESEISNPEVLEAIKSVREDLQGFSDINVPTSLIQAPAYLGSLGTQLGQLIAHGEDLRKLCDAND